MGLTANVVANTPILSAWGNEIRDRSVQNFASAAERASQWVAPPEGAVSYLRDVDLLSFWNGTAWLDFAAASTGALGEVGFFRQATDVGIPGPLSRLNVSVMAPLRPNRKYKATLICQISFTAAATVNLQWRAGTTPGVAPAAQDIVNRGTYTRAAGSFETFVLSARWLNTYAAGTYEVGLWGSTSAVATLVQGGGAFTDLIVEDIGA